MKTLVFLSLRSFLMESIPIQEAGGEARKWVWEALGILGQAALYLCPSCDKAKLALQWKWEIYLKFSMEQE